MAHFDPQRLEQQLHRTLRSLPDRRAPRTLEARVLAAIVARQTLPWWQQSFTHWPLAARAGFVVSTFALLLALTLTTMGGFAAAPTLLESWLAPFDGLRTACGSIAEAGLLIWQRIPTIWLYGALAGFGALYAALFGLGATAYRALVLNR